MTTNLLIGLQAILTLIFFIALLYVIGGIADNIKKIRIMLESELKRERKE